MVGTGLAVGIGVGARVEAGTGVGVSVSVEEGMGSGALVGVSPAGRKGGGVGKSVAGTVVDVGAGSGVSGIAIEVVVEATVVGARVGSNAAVVGGEGWDVETGVSPPPQAREMTVRKETKTETSLALPRVPAVRADGPEVRPNHPRDLILGG